MDPIAALDQVKATAPLMAGVLGAFYVCLVREGMPEWAAVSLTSDYMTGVLNRPPEVDEPAEDDG